MGLPGFAVNRYIDRGPNFAYESEPGDLGLKHYGKKKLHIPTTATLLK